MNKAFLSLTGFLLLSFLAHAQEVWTLERCIYEALDKNLTIQQYKLNKSGADINTKLTRRERIPSLNFGSDFGLSFGRVVNPATNDFETENSLYHSMSINSGFILYNGGRIRNSVQQSDLYVSSAEKEIQRAEEDVALNVALYYLNVLFAYENLEIAEARAELSKQQLDHIDKQIAAGSRAENDRYDILSQSAIDDQALITAQNNLDINLLALKQSMLMEADYPLQIERPNLEGIMIEALENQPFEVVYQTAVANQPQIQAAQFRHQANELGVSIAKSQRLPTLTTGGSLGTNWSNLSKTPTGYYTQRVTQPGVYINGDPAVFQYDTDVPIDLDEVPYGEQLDNSLGYGWGVSLSVPILNNYSNQASIERAKIDVLNSEIETELLKQTLKTNIENALTSARASRKSLDGAEAAALAARKALDNAESRFEVGTLSNFDYLSARIRSDNAENNVLIAKYDYYFNVKVIEYYLGRGIHLD